MSLFQILSILGIGGCVGVALLHYVLIARRQPHPGHGERRVRRYSLWERLIHVVLAVTFLVLAVTGFWASIGWDGPMSGYTLMIHTTCGAVFAVCVAVSLLTWAADHALARHDSRWLARGGGFSTRGDLPAGRFSACDKIYFWLAGLLTLAALLSMLLSMITLLGTDGQHLMYHVHRYSTLVLVILTLWHGYATSVAKRGGVGAILSGRVSRSWARRYHPLWGGGRGEPQQAGTQPD